MRRKILVVDDEPDLEVLLQRLLRKRIRQGELEILFAHNGMEALSLLNQAAPVDVVMTDINMPRLDGLALLEQLFELQPLIPTIVISAFSDMTRVRTAMNRGAFDFLVKPLDLKDLEATIDKALRHVVEQEEKEELRRQKKAAEAANQTKDVFLANMSHELRTPLNAIIGYGEMLIEDLAEMDRDEARGDLEKIITSGKHLLRLINEMLDLSKIQAGKMELFLETVPIPPLVNDVISTVEPLVERNRNQLVVECPDSLGVMYVDATKLRQSLFNLLSNASKFTQDGEVVLRVQAEEATGLDWVIFTVSDTGIGMTEEQLTRLFQPFMQANASVGRDYGGTGLGLTITRHLCRLMGGDVSVQSCYQQGATFTIRLPRRDRRRRALDRRQRSDQPPPNL